MIKIVLKKSSQKNLWNSIFAFFLAAFLLCGCSGKSSKTIIRLQKMEENVGSPTTEAELKDAIKKYQDRVTDIQLANSQIGIWYKMLATRYLDAKMYGEALKTFQTAIQYYPANQNLFYYGGGSCRRKNKNHKCGLRTARAGFMQYARCNGSKNLRNRLEYSCNRRRKKTPRS